VRSWSAPQETVSQKVSSTREVRNNQPTINPPPATRKSQPSLEPIRGNQAPLIDNELLSKRPEPGAKPLPQPTLGRIRLDDKHIINCRADVNQLEPIKYHWAWDKYMNSRSNFWMPNEIDMSDDKALWNRKNGLTKNERLIVERSLGFFSTADSLVGNNLVFSVYDRITNPECRLYLIRQIDEEMLHTHAYQFCIESLGLNREETFNMYHEIPSIQAKAQWAERYTSSLQTNNDRDGDYTEEDDRTLLRNLIAFYCVMEGMFFYCGFAQVLGLMKDDKMTGLGKQFLYILRDESAHVSFGIDVINQIKNENPHLWNDEMRAEATNMIVEGTGLEIQFAKETMPEGVVNINAVQMERYLKFIANRRLQQIDLPKYYDVNENPFPWLSGMLDTVTETNFFEKRVTDYQVGGAVDWS